MKTVKKLAAKKPRLKIETTLRSVSIAADHRFVKIEDSEEAGKDGTGVGFTTSCLYVSDRDRPDEFSMVFLDIEFVRHSKKKAIPYTGTVSVFATIDHPKNTVYNRSFETKIVRCAVPALMKLVNRVVSVITKEGPYSEYDLTDADIDGIISDVKVLNANGKEVRMFR